MIEKFEDLIAWQKARVLAIEISQIVNKLIAAKDYSLADQITRSSRSIMSNIAEGYGRYTFKDFKQFLTVARGSLTETQNHLYVTLDMKYLTQEEFLRLYDISVDVYKLINGLIAYLKNTSKIKKQP